MECNDCKNFEEKDKRRKETGFINMSYTLNAVYYKNSNCDYCQSENRECVELDSKADKGKISICRKCLTRILYEWK